MRKRTKRRALRCQVCKDPIRRKLLDEEVCRPCLKLVIAAAERIGLTELVAAEAGR